MNSTIKMILTVFMIIIVFISLLMCALQIWEILFILGDKPALGPGLARTCYGFNIIQIKGRVLDDATLKPLTGAKVTIRSMRPPVDCEFYQYIPDIELVTDAKGNFVYPHNLRIDTQDLLSIQIKAEGCGIYQQSKLRETSFAIQNRAGNFFGQYIAYLSCNN